MNESQSKLGMFEERPQQRLLSASPLERLLNRVVQVGGILGKEVRQVTVLGLRPNLFNRIELRGIGRQPFDPQTPREAMQEPSGCRTMDLPTVPRPR
jgi:hypothetical protein